RRTSKSFLCQKLPVSGRYRPFPAAGDPPPRHVRLSSFAHGRPRENTMEPILISVNDAARTLSLGRTSIYALIKQGELETVKIGTRTLIRVASVRKLVEKQD